MSKEVSPRSIALTAITIALVAVVTRFLIFPIGQGYFNFSDTAIYFVAFTFGPWIGFLAGGIGAALADLSAGYAAFAPLTFLAHGLQGLVAGWVARRGPGTPMQRMAVAWLGGTLTMAGIYFLGEYFGARLGWGGPAQAAAELPFNLLQNVAGGLVAVPLSLLVRRAYPPLARYTE
ncbi:MAG: ECF transporter S component [Caldilineales bacterium]|nr:ECF transporter S component [Caldilineales bacterium]MDW8317005.1 ECF transporter S component [Anaerolineae bacterium]